MNPLLFKAYDVRGVYPDELNEENVEIIGRAFAQWLREKFKIQNSKFKIVVARDVRLSGPSLQTVLARGLVSEGASVVDIGMVTTEMLYFAVAQYGYDGGVMISASHNEAHYNGLKFVREGAQAISSDTGLFEIRDIALKISAKGGSPPKGGQAASGGQISNSNVQTRVVLDDYIDYLLQTFAPKTHKPFRVVATANFGMAGNVIERLIERGKLPVTIIPLDFEPDGSFPKGKPDPLIEKRREETVALIKKEKPDFGVAWDADADRCFFFDEQGGFIQGYYTISILAKYLLNKHPGESVIFDPRQTWASISTVTEAGGKPIISKSGHSFIKDRMRKENAVFGGENSGHYYFRDFFGVDSGMIPILLLFDLLSEETRPLSAIADDYRTRYPTSGEINSTVQDAEAIMRDIEQRYSDGTVDKIDGLSVEYPEWRFNLRTSNTEPLLRLNVEATTPALLEEKTNELLSLIRA